MGDETNRVIARRRRGLWKNVALGLLPTVCLVVLAEVVVRATGAAEGCPGFQGSILWACDPILHFKPNPLQVIYGRPLNADGFRSRAFAAPRRGVYQILALGDSCTFGVISPDARDGLTYIREPYPQRLDRLLAARAGPGRFEVFNGAVPGYNSFQGVMLLRSKLRRLRPDLITVRFGWNDHLMSAGGDSAFREPTNAVALAVQDLLLQTALYPFSQRLGMTVRAHLLASHGEVTLPRAWKPDIPLDAYAHNLERIVTLARARGAAVWFLTAPQGALSDADVRRYEHAPSTSAVAALLALNALQSIVDVLRIHDTYNAVVREVGGRLGVPVIDMDTAYHEHARQPLFTFNDLIHPTQAGHRLEAEVLYEHLVAEVAAENGT